MSPLSSAFFYLLLYLSTLGLIIRPALAQRNLLHWQRDLDIRLSSYYEQRGVISKILTTSIYSPSQAHSVPIQIPGNQVRFSDLIITNGSLILEHQTAQPILDILINNTQAYVNMKIGELNQVHSLIDNIQNKLDRSDFIHKGSLGAPPSPTNIIKGQRIFKQFSWANMVIGDQVILEQINSTNVEQVLKDTYRENLSLSVRDSQQRLYFGGIKTFWRPTIFRRSLKSGCCNRMRPIHTSRMMIRSRPQDISAPVLFHTNNQYMNGPVIINELNSMSLANRVLAVGLISNYPNDNGMIPSLRENIIVPQNLINIRDTKVMQFPGKTLIFKDALSIGSLFLLPSLPDNKFVIDIGREYSDRFDLSHENYLLRDHFPKTPFIQRLEGTLVINGATRYFANIEANYVNNIQNLAQFVDQQIVRIDRPAIIDGQVQFNALPSVITLPDPLKTFTIVNVEGSLEVGTLNGMRIPQDIVLLPQNPDRTIHIRGSREFSQPIVFHDFVEVKQLVNNILMPDGVIPLHMNDPQNLHALSNIWFVDGIVVGDMMVHGGYFDDIPLSDNYSDAQSLILKSLIMSQPNGSQVIRAALNVKNLQFIGKGPGRGLLNGIRPEDIIELSRQPLDPVHTVYGRKTFLAPVEAVTCNFNEINHIPNWMGHLIRVDQPNTVQTVHTKLAFSQIPIDLDDSVNRMPLVLQNLSSSISIARLRVEFIPLDDSFHHSINLRLSPEFYVLHQALLRGIEDNSRGRIRVHHIRLMNPQALVNGVSMDDLITLDKPFNFAGHFVMVGKVEVQSVLSTNRITASYAIDVLDLEQFNTYRIPITGVQGPIRLNNLVLSSGNQASYVRTRLLNGISFDEFINSIMSLTKPQDVDANLTFLAPVSFEGLVHTGVSLNGIKDFRQLANNLKTVGYTFEDGLQCNSVLIKAQNY